jgi:hypothetical protein
MRVLLCLLLLNGLVLVAGWGAVGHSIVAQLAQSQLNEQASTWVRSLVPWFWNGNLSMMASWADNILYPDTNPHGYPNWQWSRPLHYINTPDWVCGYQADRDCVNETCIAGAIRNYTRRSQTELDEVQQQDALYFLVHYVGDIHQPLHTGFTSDLGANLIRGYDTTSLLEVFDRCSFQGSS